MVIGTKLGQFEISGPLGRGGMGEVYRARDTKLGRDVAIKVMPEEIARDADYIARFQREAVALAALNHPNVAGLYGFEEAEDTHFLVMELVEGETLAERIERGALSIEEAIPIFMQIAEGLEAAHERSIVHRDLKPANIKITPKGMVKILDFGMAKETGLQPQASSPNATTKPVSPSPGTLTTAGMILGTPNYMSPEQARGLPVDKRTDIWAFGCCLYQALTGEIPFQGATVMDIITEVMKSDPNWDKLPSRLPNQVTHLLRRSLEKDSDKRLRDIADARIGLGEAAENPEYEKDASSAKRSSPVALLVVAMLSAIVAAAAAWVAKPAPELPKPEVRRYAIDLDPDLEVHNARVDLALSPDGQWLAFVANHEDVVKIWLQDFVTGETRPLEDTDGGRSPFFSPDGAWIGFGTGNDLKKVSINTGIVSQIADVGLFRGGSWNSEGKILYTPGTRFPIMLIDAAGGDLEIVTELNAADSGHRWPQWLPGENAFLYVSSETSAVVSEIRFSLHVHSLDTGKSTELVPGAMYGRYTNSGHLVYARDGALMAARFDLDTLSMDGRSVPVIDDILSFSNFGSGEFAISDSGTLVYAIGEGVGLQDTELFWIDMDGSRTPFPIAPGPFAAPRFSPDGSQLALGRFEEGGENIYVFDVERPMGSLLTFDGTVNHTPVWTPDGEHIIFASNRTTPGINFFMKSADGSGEAVPLTSDPAFKIPMDVAPDGETLLYMVGNMSAGSSSGVWDIYTLPLSGDGDSRPYANSVAEEIEGRISPNGKWALYNSDESGAQRLYVRPFPMGAGKWLISDDQCEDGIWSPDGSRIFFRSGKKMLAVDVYERSESALALSTPTVLFEHPISSIRGPQFDITPDGNRFLVVSQPKGSGRTARKIRVVTNWFTELNELVPTQTTH